MKKHKLTKEVEKLINPITVGTLHFFQTMTTNIPKKIQYKIIKKGSKENPLMGFVVDPYAYFLFYEITNKEYFSKMLPEGYELEKTNVYKDEEAKYYFILSAFNARTSAFIGSRLEGYVIAKNIKTKQICWIIVDYDTNTISYDFKHGLRTPTVTKSVVTTDFSGDVIVDMCSYNGDKKLKLTSNIKEAKFKKLGYELWTEGNFSVVYGKHLSDSGDEFSLRFNPLEMIEALDVDPQQLNLEENTWYRDYIKEDPDRLVCFPYAQHFISDSPGFSTKITNEEELKKSIQDIDFTKVKVYSSASFKKMMIINTLVMLSMIFILTITSIYFYFN